MRPPDAGSDDARRSGDARRREERVPQASSSHSWEDPGSKPPVRKESLRTLEDGRGPRKEARKLTMVGESPQSRALPSVPQWNGEYPGTLEVRQRKSHHRKHHKKKHRRDSDRVYRKKSKKGQRTGQVKKDETDKTVKKAVKKEPQPLQALGEDLDFCARKCQDELLGAQETLKQSKDGYDAVLGQMETMEAEVEERHIKVKALELVLKQHQREIKTHGEAVGRKEEDFRMMSNNVENLKKQMRGRSPDSVSPSLSSGYSQSDDLSTAESDSVNTAG